MLELKIANNKMISDLKKLFQISFDEENLGFVDYFFKNKVEIKNTLVAMENKKIVSALYLLETSIVENNILVPSYYLYAASTFKQYQNKGYMTKLLKYADEISKKRKIKYILLLPENNNLYDYYKKNNYITLPGAKFVTLSSNELEVYCNKNTLYSNHLSFENIFKIRKNYFNKNGCLFWDKKSIKYAFNFTNFYCHGKIIFNKNNYAICLLNKKTNSLKVIELVCTNQNDFFNLISEIKCEFKCKNYEFRLPVYSTLFKGLGEIKKFGMIKNLTSSEINFSNIYIGLTLE